MSPLGLILMGIGLLMIVIGFKGSQHSVMNAFKGIHSGKTSGKTGGDSGNNPGNNPGHFKVIEPPQLA